MKKQLCLIFGAVLALVLCGCSNAGAYGRELEDTVLVQVLGVDAMEGGITLTAAGTGGEAENGGEEETAMGTASGATLEDAFRNLPTAGNKYFSLTSVTQVIVGDGVDLRQVLGYVLEDPDMSWTATVWAVNGFAGKLMEETRDGGLERFTVLERSGLKQVSVKEALADLLSEGETALPALSARDGALEPLGTLYVQTVFHSGKRPQ